ncbi:hypothetical protein HY450_01625 [Candidatus Pacearchaeota archaeon]|nr:hypothetical protein [Candidatus Pacearchaeota archaeon]
MVVLRQRYYELTIDSIEFLDLDDNEEDGTAGEKATEFLAKHNERGEFNYRDNLLEEEVHARITHILYTGEYKEGEGTVMKRERFTFQEYLEMGRPQRIRIKELIEPQI